MRRRTRAIGGALLALLASGCGVVIDLAYLLDDGKYHKVGQQRRPTGQLKVTLEREVRVLADGRSLGVLCEERTRSIDRAWTVDKTYQTRGGYYQAHWAPIILEGVVAAGLGIGLGVKCSKADSDLDCATLWWTAPLVADVAYSTVRLLTIEKPKLIDKQYGTPYFSDSAPIARAAQPCDGTTVVVGLTVDEAVVARVPVASNGSLDAEGQALVLEAYASGPSMKLFVVGPDGQEGAVAVNRCAYLRAHQAELAARWHEIVKECPPPQGQGQGQPEGQGQAAGAEGQGGQEGQGTQGGQPGQGVQEQGGETAL